MTCKRGDHIPKHIRPGSGGASLPLLTKYGYNHCTVHNSTPTAAAAAPRPGRRSLLLFITLKCDPDKLLQRQHLCTADPLVLVPERLSPSVFALPEDIQHRRSQAEEIEFKLGNNAAYKYTIMLSHSFNCVVPGGEKLLLALLN